MTDLSVRPATGADLPVMASVRVRAWRSAYRELLPAEYLAGLDPAELVAGWTPLLDEPERATLLVADLPGTGVVGFTNVGPYRQDDGTLDPAYGELRSCYVDPDTWRNGAGSALLHASVDLLRAAAPRPVRLWVVVQNDRARRFYERFGFAPDGATGTFDAGDVSLRTVRYVLTA